MLRKTVCFVWTVLALLAVVAAVAPDGGLRLGACDVRLPVLAEVLKVSRTPDSAMTVEGQLAAMEADMVMPQEAVDSVTAERPDTLAFYRNFFKTSKARIAFPCDDMEYLFPFFEAAESAQNGVVHVIHYGDSQIEGDRITGLLRDSLQGLFGGSGPGLLPLWQPIRAKSVGQQLSDSIPTFYAGGMMGKRARHSRYGAMAQVAELTNASVRLNVEARQCTGFRSVRAFVGNTGDSLVVRLGEQTRRADARRMSLQILDMQLKDDILEMEFSGSGEIYGLEVDGGKGLSVSNIPMRGSDGSFFGRMDSGLAGRMLRALNTRLIILEFGGNALPLLKDSSQVKNYAEFFGSQIREVQGMVPDAPILVVGPSDMSIKRGSEMVTYPLLPLLVDEMRKVSNDNEAAYWDIFAVMGGENSMKTWVEHKPALAATDYVHFTTRGANRIATVLWESLLMSYHYYNLVRGGEQ